VRRCFSDFNVRQYVFSDGVEGKFKKESNAVTFAKKLNKFQKNPKLFFADSKKPLMKMINGLIQSTPASSKMVKSIPSQVAGTTKPNVKSTTEFDRIRSMQPGFSNKDNQIDLWRVYREDAKKDIELLDVKHRFAIYPLGVHMLDKLRDSMYTKDGCATFFLPLWEELDSFGDLDDFEYLANKSPLVAHSVAKRLLAIASSRKATAVILPYDATALTRAIAIQSRALGLVTICHFQNYGPILNLYGEDRLAAFPICDWIAVDEEFLGGLNFSEAVMRRCAVISGNSKKSESFIETTDAQRNKLRSLVGAGAVENIRIIALAPLQSTMTDECISVITLAQVNNLLSRLQPTDHLLILAKRRKNGFMSGNVVNLLKNKYRKTILFYDDANETGIINLLSIVMDAVVPVGLLPAHYREHPAVTEYALSEPDESEVMKAAESVSHDSEQNSSLQAGKELASRGFSHPGFDKLAMPRHAAEAFDFQLDIFDDVLSRILELEGPGLDLIAVPDPITNAPITNGRQKYLLELLHANRRIYGANSLREANMAEVFIQWGAEPSESKERPEVFRSQLSRPRLFLEDGFIRSRGLWTDPNEPTLSVVMDTRAIYYNSLQPSLLEEILNSDLKLSDAQLARARTLIDKIVENKISKYNHAPVLNLDFHIAAKKTILLIDQKAGDMSIKYGSATDESFFVMLQRALDLGDGVEIIIKQHPCAISGGAHEAHFTAESLGMVLKNNNNVNFIGFDVNPYSLINAVDEVWVVSSGMGFEGLMAGKIVRCFGVPFYAQWGITRDEVTLERRTRRRSIEEIFYVFYLILSRYIDPETGRLCELEKLVDYFSNNHGSPAC